jgi:hypothetical protein
MQDDTKALQTAKSRSPEALVEWKPCQIKVSVSKNARANRATPSCSSFRTTDADNIVVLTNVSVQQQITHLAA